MPCYRSAIFAVTCIVAGPVGCVQVCQNDFDCGTEAYCQIERQICQTDCFVDADCLHPIGCETSDEGCAPIGSVCQEGRCAGEVEPTREGQIGYQEDGWDDTPGTGRMYAVSLIAIGDSGVGFNLDDRCKPNCIDNVLAPLGQHANRPIQQGISSASTLLIIEVAGLVDGYSGRDDAVTLKIYEGADADGNSANDYSGMGSFNLRASSLVDAQAGTRVRAKIRDNRLKTDEPFSLLLTLSLGANTRPRIAFDDVRMTFVLPTNLRTFDQGVLGGSLRASSLHAVPNPYCKQQASICPAVFPDSSLLDLVTLLVNREPDVDVDGDGAECLLDTDGDQTIDLCCDALASRTSCSVAACQDSPVAPVSSADPSSCALNPKIADGYSVGMELAGIRSAYVGVVR